MKNFNFALHNIRGIAILFIVLLHTLQPVTINSQLWQLNEDWKLILFTSTSGLFAFVSGYLSLYIELPKFKISSFKDWYCKYLIKKTKVVYLPMIIASVFIFLIASTSGYALKTIPNCNDFINFCLITLSGGMQGPYWYIPFTMMMFALAPLFFLLISVKPFYRTISTLLICLLPLFFSRGQGLFFNGISGLTSLIHNILYFGPMFFLGCVFCKSEDVLKILLNNRVVNIILFILLSIIIFLLYKNKMDKTYVFLTYLNLHILEIFCIV